MNSFGQFESNFCSFKWSVFLKECGVRQDTAFHYVWDPKNDKYEICWSGLPYNEECYAAYTIQEFVDLYPKEFKLYRDSNQWTLHVTKDHISADASMDDEEKLVDVFARILITLTKNKSQTKRIGMQRRRLEWRSPSRN